MIRRWTPNVIALGLLVSMQLSSQTFRGGVTGTVSDATGAVVAGAAVKLISPDTGLTRDSTTSSAGEFVFQDLPLGTYAITVTQSGFDTVHVSGVVVDAGKINNLALTLKVAKQATTVEVQASAVQIETASSAETSLINTKQILDIPLNGRDFTQLLKFNPGANANGSFNGSRFNGIDWKIDGADNNDLWHNVNSVNQGGVSGIAGVVLPIDAIAEFSLQSSSNAEENRNSGGVLNVVIKSGTNNFHGSVYYFNRNEYFATSNWFTPPGSPSSELRNNQEGFSLGGPIVKNHTFFFMDYEQQNYKEALTAVGTTPSAAWVSEAASIMTKDGVGVNPLALTLINTLWPANSLTGPAAVHNFNGGGINLSNSYNAVIKLDHQFNERNNIAIRYFGGTGNQTEYIGSAIPSYFQVAPSRMHNFSLVYNKVITPRFLAQTTLGVNYFKQVFDDQNHGFDMPAIGLNTGVTRSTDFGSPFITISGFDPIGLTPPYGRIDATGHIDQTFTYTEGSHEFRFGADYRRSRLDVFYDANAPGTFTFDGTQGPYAINCPNDSWEITGVCPANGQSPNPSLDALADFLSGRIGIGHASIAYGSQERIYWLNGVSFFGQDTWKVTSRLTLNYGLNWVYQSPIYNPANLISTFIPADGGITYVGTHGLNTLWPRDYHDFAPRFGFAFQPTAGGKLVIRGGWGIYYQVPNLSYFGNSVGPNGGATGINDNIGGPSPVLSLVNQSPITLAPGVPIFAASEASGPYGAFSVSQHFVTAYSMNTNFNIQYQAAQDVVAEVGYSGSLSRHLPDMLDINQIPIGSPELVSSRPYYSQFPYLAAINEIQSVGNGNFNGLLGSLRTTNFHGFTTKVSYTFAHSLDDLSYARGIIPQNSYCLRCDYGNSDFDIRSSFSMFLAYSVPQPPKYRAIFGGWQLNTLFSFFTGSPFTVFSGNDSSGTSEFSDRAEVVGNPFANVPAPDRATSTYFWFNPAAFTYPAQGTYSNEGRNEFYGPPTHQIDFSLFKNIKFGEHVTLQLRAEIFNIFNFRNLAQLDPNVQAVPQQSVAGSNLGQVATTYDVGFGAPGIGPGAPRNVQLAGKIIF
ncbi:MAG TPA: carboxypeptidase regulatory-like domain-containing protein [Bryobacteraceae bacterium]|nr:carboxypeptidase regulatory-like domain-containing protein [Bryobacteraceae bacterium]